MVTNDEKTSITNAEDVLRWVLDFISTDIAGKDIRGNWMLTVDAYRYLRLWDIISKDGTVFVEPPKLNLRTLQNELSSAFERYLKPLLTQEKQETHVLPFTDKLPPKVFAISYGDLVCKRLSDQNIEKIGVANFLEALAFLAPISINRFQKCEACGRWFFPQGKRVRKARRFCSRTCNLRDTARRQRERLRKVASKKPDRVRRTIAQKAMKNLQLMPNVKVGRKGK